MQFFIDRLNSVSAEGWVFSPHSSNVRVQALLDGQVIGEAVTTIERPDVGCAFNNAGNSAHSGFHLNFSRPIRRKELTSDIAFCFKAIEVSDSVQDLAEQDLEGVETFFNIAAIPPCSTKSPFPQGVTDLFMTLWPEIFDSANFGDERVQHTAVDRLEFLLSHSDRGASSELVGYFRFLNACWNHFSFVEQTFPEFQLKSKAVR